MHPLSAKDKYAGLMFMKMRQEYYSLGGDGIRYGGRNPGPIRSGDRLYSPHGRCFRSTVDGAGP
jgi:hypothetical protein